MSAGVDRAPWGSPRRGGYDVDVAIIGGGVVGASVVGVGVGVALEPSP